MKKDNFCILPFIHLSTRTNGAMQLCCHANSSTTKNYSFVKFLETLGESRPEITENLYAGPKMNEKDTLCDKACVIASAAATNMSIFA